MLAHRPRIAGLLDRLTDAICAHRREVIKGWDVAFASMAVGELANLTIAHDYGYGSAGLPPRIAPYASLFFEVELLAMGAKPPDAAGADDPMELPDAAAAATTEGSGEHIVTVGGNPVKVDRLGPIVVNKDGSLSRITNWLEMSTGEQERTLKVVAKRNKKRMSQFEQSEQPSTERSEEEAVMANNGGPADSGGPKKANSCDSAPCQNGGECYGTPVVSCVCVEGFSGSHCERASAAAGGGDIEGAATVSSTVAQQEYGAREP